MGRGPLDPERPRRNTRLQPIGTEYCPWYIMAEEEERVAAEVQPKAKPKESKAKARAKAEPKVKWAPVRANARPKATEPEVPKLDGQLGRIQAQLQLLEWISRNPW